MKTIRWIFPILAMLFLTGNATAQIRMITKKLHQSASSVNTSPANFTEEEAMKAILEALQVGIDSAVKLVSQTDGYYGNPQIRIPFPESVSGVESKLRGLGMGSLVDEAILTMNRAAEEAAKEAIPIFTRAISGLTVSDAIAIVNGADDAATQYLKQTSTPALREAFEPVIRQALDRVNATQAWAAVINTYNQIPFVAKQNADLPQYVTGKAIDGLFVMMAKEELKIRKNPVDRVTDLLKKVFG